jgi:hypothetical protein
MTGISDRAIANALVYGPLLLSSTLIAFFDIFVLPPFLPRYLLPATQPWSYWSGAIIFLMIHRFYFSATPIIGPSFHHLIHRALFQSLHVAGVSSIANIFIAGLFNLSWIGTILGAACAVLALNGEIASAVEKMERFLMVNRFFRIYIGECLAPAPADEIPAYDGGPNETVTAVPAAKNDDGQNDEQSGKYDDQDDRIEDSEEEEDSEDEEEELIHCSISDEDVE